MDNLNKSGQKPVEIQDTNFITLLKNPQKFKETFYELTCVASESIKAQQYQKALRALGKCTDMLDLGKNILKDISKYWKLCIYGNLACAYQGTWKMPKCHKFCEKIQEELNRLLLQSAEPKQNYLNITKYIIRIKFQHCAILSQLNLHEKALEMCKSTLPTLQKYILSVLEYAQSLSINDQDKKCSQTVHFSKQVSAFAEQILKNLLRNLNDPLALGLDKSSFYYWQKNPENNEQQVKKKFVSGKGNDACKRSILGVNKMTHWIDEFNIGTIMHMSQLTINDFQHPLPIQQYIFKDKLFQIVIYCSVAHFTIATEMRFIQSSKEKQKIQEEPKPQGAPQKSNVHQSIIKKYGYQQKSQMFKLSELYHLRAIHIMAQNIKSTVPYISHLIKSYDKHYIYKKQLQPVIAIDEESLLSVIEPNQRKPEEKYNNDGDQNNYFVFEGEKQTQQQNEQEKNNFVGYLSEREPLPSNDEDSQEKMQMVPTYVLSTREKQKARNKSLGKVIKTARQKTRSKCQKNEQDKPKKKKQKAKINIEGKTNKQAKEGKESKKKKPEHIEGEVRINHQSCTQIKLVVFKKKK